jgi:tetratricopeptide (TPR) repeat protein
MMERTWARRCIVALLWLGLLQLNSARADQYHSQVRMAPSQSRPQVLDAQKQLQSTNDPYAKAMLLREMAASAAQRKDYNAAAGYLQQALAMHALSDPAEEQMRGDLARLRIGSGDSKAVIATLEPLYRANPNLPPEQLAALGAAYVREKRYRDAVPPLQKSIAATRASDVSWRRALYAAYLGNGEEREAARVLETVVRDQPNAREDWFRLTALYWKTGDRPRAQAALETASRLGYLDSADKRLQLVSLTAQIGAPFEAGSLLCTWMEKGQLPRDAANLRTLAALWVHARESSLAIPAIEDALRAQPDRALYLQLGQLHLDREEYAAAAKAFAQAIAAGAKTGPAYMALGMALYQQADVDGAVAAFREAGNFPQGRTLAAQWVKYLESGKAREQALLAVNGRVTRDDAAPALASAIAKAAPITLTDVDAAGAPASPSSAAPDVASGSAGLTAIGAEQAGNRDGTIPPWTGGLTRSQWPANYKPGDRLVDPFPNDKPLFTIDASNAAQYAARLSDGHKVLLAKYADYTMPVYATRRTAAYPQAIETATRANLGRAKTVGTDSIAGARLGFPFPQPQTGAEVMWNHRLRYRGDTVEMQSTEAVEWPNGTRDMTKETDRVYFRYANLKDAVDMASHNVLLYFLGGFSKGLNGPFWVLVHETADQQKEARGVWVAMQSLRKVMRIPPVGYDQPLAGSSGVQFIDMFDMYNGPLDRYVWKLIGKRELYIPYNEFRINDGSLGYAQLLRPGHFNQRPVRYELHRVWVIEAVLRPGKLHRFGKRVFYVDEDSWNIVLVENYDHDGKLWRFQEGHLLPNYDIQFATCAPVITYDLMDGRYFAARLLAEDSPPRFGMPMNESDFTPAAVGMHYLR